MSRRQPAAEDLVSPENPNAWIFEDYGLLEDIPVPGGHLPSLDPSLPCSTPLRRSSKLGSSQHCGTHACLSLLRMSCLAMELVLDLLNLLGIQTILMKYASENDPGRSSKMDKAAILVDAVRMVTQLRDEAQKLRESNESLQVKINELKAEKNELRDEKQKLKTERDNLERQIKALDSKTVFVPQATAIPTPVSTPSQVVGGKLVPFVGFPRVSMWQFLPPAAVDISQDHILRPSVA
ncbi:DNA binding protein, putative isoform 2 [Hibiscus syriacus]|uniref:DNA binding protein, putative isoform 2 n=1 Tax=Hibiscus syriacus TaxID=106335 RepID=A0A6A3AT90_HIBSY|nr:DNA binding protein, putative isoform 2 [Hibiscus syriacus]